MPGTDQATHTTASAQISPRAAFAVRQDREAMERRRDTEAAFDRIGNSGDPETHRSALEEVVLANLGVARSLASRYRGRGIPEEDLEQVAYAALIVAANRFRPEEARDFLSFAVPTIRGELRRHFRDSGWAVRPPRRVQEIQLRVLAAQDRMAGSLDRTPTAAEIAEELGECPRHVSEALTLDGCFTPASLDAPVESGTATVGDLLPDVSDVSNVETSAEARVMLGRAVRELDERDRYVVRLRYFDDLTQKEIGDELGLTQAQVSRILARITRQLHACLTSSYGPHELAS